MVIAAESVANSEWLTLALALLNVAQTVWLADIASRARRIRKEDRQQGRRSPRQRSSRPPNRRA